jgi:hypothetical protein
MGAEAAAAEGDGDRFRLATPADRTRVCATIGAAFVSAASPEMSYFFGDRFAELAPVFAGNLFDKRVSRSTVWVTADCDAAALWDAPEPPSSSEVTEEPAPVALPVDVQERLDEYDRVIHDLLPPQPHWCMPVCFSGEHVSRCTGLTPAHCAQVLGYLGSPPRSAGQWCGPPPHADRPRQCVP